MNKKNNFFLLFLFVNIFQASSAPILEITIPKTGTHLLASCLNLLTYKEVKNLINNFDNIQFLNDQLIVNAGNNLKNFSKNFFFHLHLQFNQNNANFIRSLYSKCFFMLRDPRDQVISFMYWIYKSPESFPPYFYLNPDELICKIIRETKNLYLSYLGWMKEPNFITIRFEDLIGPKGGGNRKKQVNTILCIARHINYYCSQYRAEYIADSLFGRSPTFREGQIDTWKNYFTNKHKRLFKKECGQLLIDLKYEKDFNW